MTPASLTQFRTHQQTSVLSAAGKEIAKTAGQTPFSSTQHSIDQDSKLLYQITHNYVHGIACPNSVDAVEDVLGRLPEHARRKVFMHIVDEQNSDRRRDDVERVLMSRKSYLQDMKENQYHPKSWGSYYAAKELLTALEACLEITSEIGDTTDLTRLVFLKKCLHENLTEACGYPGCFFYNAFHGMGPEAKEYFEQLLTRRIDCPRNEAINCVVDMLKKMLHAPKANMESFVDLVDAIVMETLLNCKMSLARAEQNH